MAGHTTDILLLRHGQTAANASGTLQGHQPTPLNLTGVRQATLLADRLGAWRPRVRALVSSDLPRAAQTAGPIAAACHLSVKTDARWRERGFGLLEGKPVGSREIWQVAGGEVDPPGAEPSADFLGRVRQALLAVAAAHRGRPTVAVVTHGGPIRCVLKMLIDGRLSVARGQPPVRPGADRQLLGPAPGRPPLPGRRPLAGRGRQRRRPPARPRDHAGHGVRLPTRRPEGNTKVEA